MNTIVKIQENPSENNNIEVMIVVEDKQNNNLPLKCKKCQAFFHSKLHLVSHVASCHSPSGFEHRCPFCTEFSHQRRKKVLKHMKKHHKPEFPFKCDACLVTFECQLYLKLHKKQVSH